MFFWLWAAVQFWRIRGGHVLTALFLPLIFRVDACKGVEENVQTGINLSRSTVRTFKHNDMDDLERVLQVYGSRQCVSKRGDRKSCSTDAFSFSFFFNPPGEWVQVKIMPLSAALY